MRKPSPFTTKGLTGPVRVVADCQGEPGRYIRIWSSINTSSDAARFALWLTRAEAWMREGGW